jgi:hypothetical protein
MRAYLSLAWLKEQANSIEMTGIHHQHDLHPLTGSIIPGDSGSPLDLSSRSEHRSLHALGIPRSS